MNARLGLSIGGDGLYGGGSTTPGNSSGMLARGGMAYHPTVAYLIVLVLLEFFAVVAFRFLFRTTHGG